jgi:hypothetical protein
MGESSRGVWPWPMPDTLLIDEDSSLTRSSVTTVKTTTAGMMAVLGGLYWFCFIRVIVTVMAVLGVAVLGVAVLGVAVLGVAVLAMLDYNNQPVRDRLTNIVLSLR